MTPASATQAAEPLVWLDGEITPLSEARIPVLDRGFIFGDGIYEVVPVYALADDEGTVRVPFRFAQHLARDAHANFYVQVTRGVAPRGHAFPAAATPTVFAMVNPLKLPGVAQREHGVRFEAREIAEAELREADEILVTSATKEVLAVVALDGKPVGGGKPGPVYAAYQRAKQREAQALRAAAAGLQEVEK